MVRAQTVFLCADCGGETLKWQGQCPHCGAWNTLARHQVPADQGGGRVDASRPVSVPVNLEAGLAAGELRCPTGIAEFDRVLGGGYVPGSVTLLGGDPGIGKSTLLLQVAAAVARNDAVLYVSGEESVAQIAMRARRLGLSAGSLGVLAESELDALLNAAQQLRARLLIVDSIQTLRSGSVEAGAGAVSQLRECTAALVRFAKASGVSVMIIGHVTKDGAIAGPRVLEHFVDTVLYFAADAGSRFRIVRATKNRFGPVNELAFFHMSESGLREVRNPAAIFLARPDVAAPGSIVTVTHAAARPLLVELQALVDRMRVGNPRRVAQGLDSNRLAMLLAVLGRHAGVSLQEYDVFANVVGGLEIEETAADLPLALALASSVEDRALPRDLVAFGEIGLAGEVRPVAYGEERLTEAARQGFRTALVSAENVPRRPIAALDVRAVRRIDAALAISASLARGPERS